MRYWTAEMERADALLFGRVTYEMMESAWRRPATGPWPDWMDEWEVPFAEAIDAHMPGLKSRIRLIAYVRPHAERLLAGFAERTKLGTFGGTLEELHLAFSETGILDYARRFRKWREVFGDAFTLRPMIARELTNNDVVHDFLNFVAQGGEFSISGSTRVNESLSLEDLAVLRLVHARIREGNPDLRTEQKSLGFSIAKLLIANAGAYGFAMANRYNLRELPQEEIIND